MVFRIHIDPILGHLPVIQVRPSHLRVWVKNRSAVLASSTLAGACSYHSQPDPPGRLGTHLGTGTRCGRYP